GMGRRNEVGIGFGLRVDTQSGLFVNAKHGLLLAVIEREELGEAPTCLAIAEVGALDAPVGLAVSLLDIDKVSHLVIGRQVARIRDAVFKTRRLSAVGSRVATLHASHPYSGMDCAVVQAAENVLVDINVVTRHQYDEIGDDVAV